MEANHLMPVYNRYPVVLAQGTGAEVYDTQGRHYWDFLAGIGVNSLGYNHPAIQEALARSAPLIHTSNLFWTEEGIQLSNKMADIAGGFLSLWVNSGTEANEAGIKLLRRYGKTVRKDAILSLSGGFHGRTMGSLSATFVPAYQDPFTPLVPEFFEVEAGNIGALRAAMEQYRPCGLMVESIQGEGGVVPLPPGYLSEAAQVAHEFDCLLLVDEVQTGIGRTGQWFGFQHEDISPDIITVAKGLGAGVPIGAMLARDSVAQYFQPGDHGTTFGGNPLAARAGLAVLTWLEEEGLAHVRQMSQVLEGRLQQLAGEYPDIVMGYRGRGLMWGIVVSAPAKDLVQMALDRGLILNAPKPNVIRLLPPLIVGEEGIAGFYDILSGVLEQWRHTGR